MESFFCSSPRRATPSSLSISSLFSPSSSLHLSCFFFPLFPHSVCFRQSVAVLRRGKRVTIGCEFRDNCWRLRRHRHDSATERMHFNLTVLGDPSVLTRSAGFPDVYCFRTDILVIVVANFYYRFPKYLIFPSNFWKDKASQARSIVRLSRKLEIIRICKI